MSPFRSSAAFAGSADRAGHTSATTRLSITALVDSLKASSSVSYIPYIRVSRPGRRTPASAAAPAAHAVLAHKRGVRRSARELDRRGRAKAYAVLRLRASGAMAVRPRVPQPPTRIATGDRLA
jgi:hypothetical protein